MAVGRIILYDQLHLANPLLSNVGDDDYFICIETEDIFCQVPHHKKKLMYLLASYRLFVQRLKKINKRVVHVAIDQADNSQSFHQELNKIEGNTTHLICMQPSEHNVQCLVDTYQTKQGAGIEQVTSVAFLCSDDAFKQWASGRKTLLMENFYRTMRQKYQMLMEGAKPVGGKWNFDKENRKVPKESLVTPTPYTCQPCRITQSVIELVNQRYQHHFGDGESFNFATCHEQAKQALALFIKERLPYFGDYQDAMLHDNDWMYHSHLSIYINNGLLDAMACIQSATTAYHQGHVSINNVEGFVRQIVGWREYIKGIYTWLMPKYRKYNELHAKRSLPQLYWTGETKMQCLKACVATTRQNAYAHHIQWLMVLGNFALLAGVNPNDVNHLYWVVYFDAYEWAELPNVTGMALYADGGVLAIKPYASSGAYINKMSNYCKQCHYQVKEKLGQHACPFNYLYWYFLMQHEDKLAHNHRMRMIYSTLNRMGDDKKRAIIESAEFFLKHLDQHKL